jgi:hypothetical protein
MILLIGFIPCVKCQEEVCQSKWGDSPTGVKKNEKIKLTTLKDGSLSGESFFILERYKANYNFSFDEAKKFNELWITIELPDFDVTNFTKDFDDLALIFNMIYYKEENCYINWKDNYYKGMYSDYPELYGLALALGYCSKICSWSFNGTSAVLLLYGKNLGAKIIAHIYEDRK